MKTAIPSFTLDPAISVNTHQLACPSPVACLSPSPSPFSIPQPLPTKHQNPEPIHPHLFATLLLASSDKNTSPSSLHAETQPGHAPKKQNPENKNTSPSSVKVVYQHSSDTFHRESILKQTNKQTTRPHTSSPPKNPSQQSDHPSPTQPEQSSKKHPPRPSLASQTFSLSPPVPLVRRTSRPPLLPPRPPQPPRMASKDGLHPLPSTVYT